MQSRFSSVYVSLSHFYKNRTKAIYVDAKGILTKRNKNRWFLFDSE